MHGVLQFKDIFLGTDIATKNHNLLIYTLYFPVMDMS